MSFHECPLSLKLSVNCFSFALSNLYLWNYCNFKLLMTGLTSLYLLLALYYFMIWLNIFRKDTDLSLEEKHLSWIVLIVATIFWPITVPISYFEKHLNHPYSLCETSETENEFHSLLRQSSLWYSEVIPIEETAQN